MIVRKIIDLNFYGKRTEFSLIYRTAAGYRGGTREELSLK